MSDKPNNCPIDGPSRDPFQGSAFDFIKALTRDRTIGMKLRVAASLALGTYQPKPVVAAPRKVAHGD
jgi:hypothetical protein